MPRLSALARPGLFALALLASACASIDGAADGDTLHAHAAAHGPRAAPGGGWVVVVTAAELAALGVGQKMELDAQAPDVVYVVDYGRADQLDAVFARTLGGLMPIRMLLPELAERGRVVLRTRPGAMPESTVGGEKPAARPDAGVSASDQPT
ncbi:MAG: hypothetical protein R3F65_06435 [bacterium]|nr:hypothetical protein [Myxococcales bacterium]